MPDTVESVADATASLEVKQPDGEAKPEESEADPSPAVTDPPDDTKQALKGVGKRIDELTRNWRETERDRNYWREMALRNQQAKPEPERTASKTLADFEYDEGKYAAHLREQTSKDAVEAARRELKAEQERQNAANRLSEFRTRESKFAALTPDYAEVAHFAPVSDAVAGLVMEMDEGPAVAYYLGKNPEIARKLSQLSESRVGIELGRIEARLLVEREKAKEKPVSKAPPPTPKIEAMAATEKVSTTSPESDRMSDEEWAKAERARLKKKRA